MNAPTGILATLFVLASYLVGAIPFGYLTAKWLGGIDIRALGSGNIGATNVGRVMGFRFFALVFAFDLAKGLVPTWGFPLLLAHHTGRPAPPDVPVLVALAAILGHNFPVYLRFQGGKGVATSLGALLALDPVAAVASAGGFTVFLLITRYVSLSSILGGLVFFAAHFLRVEHPWARGERALSVVTVGLLLLLIVRHRKNFARIAAGTEPKVSMRRKRPTKPPEDPMPKPPDEPKSTPPAGRIAASWLVALAATVALAVGGLTIAKRLTRRDPLRIGHSTIAEVARAGTGHQRAERVAFADGGRLLAVTCPRYNRLVLYRVTNGDRLELSRDVSLAGHPVAVCPTADRLYVLQRPPGDERHVQPGWWEAFDFRGERVGERVVVGFYPDDMVLAPDGRHAFVLTSGRAEGSADRAAPALEVYPLSGPNPIGRVTFDVPRDDPARITLSDSGRAAVVTLLGTGTSASIDLVDPARPRLIGRAPLPASGPPYPSQGPEDAIVMPGSPGREAVSVRLVGLGDCLVTTLPHDSGIEVARTRDGRTEVLGRLVVRGGMLGTGKVRPTGIAYSPSRGLIALANRSGGVHLIAVRRDGSEALAASRTTGRR